MRPTGPHLSHSISCPDGLAFLLSHHHTFVLFISLGYLASDPECMILLFPVWSVSSGLAPFDPPDLLLLFTQHDTMKSSSVTYLLCLPLILKAVNVYIRGPQTF